MYPFNLTVPTTKKSPGKNDCKYIIIHHTAGGTFKSNMAYLANSQNKSSVHFVIGESEERGKIGDPTDILRHAGDSKRGNLIDMNKYSLGIEVVGYGEFNQYQFIALTDMVQYLMGMFGIPNENVLRHADITQQDAYTKDKILRDGHRKARKVDIASDFFPKGFETWRDLLYPRTQSRYGLYS